MSPEAIAQRWYRREFLTGCGLGLAGIALGELSRADEVRGAAPVTHPLAPRAPHFPAKAKRVIQLFMAGGPSQLELFDDKPKLRELNGQAVPPSYLEGQRFAFLKPDAKLLGSKRQFAQHGASGGHVSELLPHTSAIVDRLAFIKTMHTDNFSHGAAKLLTQSGYQRFGMPTMGTWVLYALGSENRDLPGYIVLQSGPRGPRGGSYLWSQGFLPSIYQGAPLRSQGEPILNLTNPPGVSASQQQRVVQTVAKMNELRGQLAGDDEIDARTHNYEMAFRLQSSAPELMDVSRETEETLRLYGAQAGQPSFALNCLLARRMAERGVRFITLFHTNWDHHGGAENLEDELEKVCRDVDQPCAALLIDLERRGLLEDTLVLWGGEFGRTPLGEQRATLGRDHHIEAYTVWLAGGGIRAGQTYGATDELGFYAQEPSQRVHIHDLQATLLHLLGLDHERLSYRYQGRNFRLTDVDGHVVKQLLA